MTLRISFEVRLGCAHGGLAGINDAADATQRQEPRGGAQPKMRDLWPRGRGYGPRAGEVPDVQQSLALGLGSGASGGCSPNAIAWASVRGMSPDRRTCGLDGEA